MGRTMTNKPTSYAVVPRKHGDKVRWALISMVYWQGDKELATVHHGEWSKLSTAQKHMTKNAL